MSELEELRKPLDSIEQAQLIDTARAAGFTSTGIMLLRRALFESDVSRERIADLERSRNKWRERAVSAEIKLAEAQKRDRAIDQVNVGIKDGQIVCWVMDRPGYYSNFHDALDAAIDRAASPSQSQPPEQ